MFCKPDDWNSCNVEKMTCKGCHFENDENRFCSSVKLKYKNELVVPKEPELRDDAIDSLVNSLNDISKLINKSKCVRCNGDEPLYCEKCYQDLVALNLQYQNQIYILEKQIEELKGEKSNGR